MELATMQAAPSPRAEAMTAHQRLGLGFRGWGWEAMASVFGAAYKKDL